STGGAGTQQLDPPAQHSPARGSLRFYAGVSCGSILLALVIGIGGFLGLRGFGEESATAPVATAETGAGAGGTDAEEAPESGADAGAEADDGPAPDAGPAPGRAYPPDPDSAPDRRTEADATSERR